MKKDIFIKYIAKIKDIVQTIKPHSTWCSSSDIEEIIKRAENNFMADVAFLREELFFLQDEDRSVEFHTQKTIKLFRTCHAEGAESYSFVAIVTVLQELMNAEFSKTLIQASLMAGILGDVENDQAYHSNLHFREVVLQTVRLMMAHNKIFAGTGKILEEEDRALLLIAAIIHDLGHTGQGNMINGIHCPANLEIRSFDYAAPYLEACGLSKEQLYKIRTMIVATDVSSIGSEDSSNSYMKRAYAYHYRTDKKYYKPELPNDLMMLEGNAKLSLMAMLLHEADISISAGLSYEVTQFETALLWEEMNHGQAKPQDIVNFVEKVCQRQFTTEAGQRLFQANIARIYTLAKEAVEKGNEFLPIAEETLFASEEETTKTIN